MINYNDFKLILNTNLENLLLLLPNEFTSGLFIDKIRELLPCDYANILNGHSHRAFNSWVARWYLQELSESGRIYKNNRKNTVITKNGFKSSNNIWCKQ